ncbi:hypothetical protein BDF14DRAFT_474413 [Spinellus fusiger]|nr:hypothetical protein BDF14DRAFT_474413 [Spinellus fusiger]
MKVLFIPFFMQPNARMEPSNDYSRHFRQNPRARRNALHAYISYMTYTDLARKRMNRHGRHASQQTHEHNHISAAVVDKPVNSPLWHAHHQHSQSMPFHHILNQNHPPNHYSGIDPHRRNSFGNRPFTTETNSTKAPIHNQDYAHRPGLESRPPITMRHSVHSVTSMPNPEHISVLSHSSSSSPAYQGAMSMAAPISPTLHHYQAQPPHSFTAVHHPLTAFLRDNTNSDQPMSVEHAHSSAHLPSLSKSAVPMTPGTAPTSNFYHASSSLSPLQSVRNGES